jgi:3-oxoadipate enol-lactonase
MLLTIPPPLAGEEYARLDLASHTRRWHDLPPSNLEEPMLLPLKGRRLCYDLAGPETAPILCFTHSLASDSGMWAEQVAPALEAGFRLLRIDMRGHGGSDPVAGDYTMEELAADVAAVLDALSIDRVHYVGLSIGGMIGQAFALRYGPRLKSMMLCDTLPAALPGAKETWAPRIAAVRQANTLEPLADGTLERWFTDAFKKRNPGRWKQIRDTVVGTTPAGFLGCGAALQNFDFVARLPSVKVPTLVVCGADDQGTPASENRRLAGLIPGGSYEEIADARHMPNIEHPDVFNRIFTGWLKANR